MRSGEEHGSGPWSLSWKGSPEQGCSTCIASSISWEELHAAWGVSLEIFCWSSLAFYSRIMFLGRQQPPPRAHHCLKASVQPRSSLASSGSTGGKFNTGKQEETKTSSQLALGQEERRSTASSLSSQYPLQHSPAHNTLTIRSVGGSRRDGAGPQAGGDMTAACSLRCCSRGMAGEGHGEGKCSGCRSCEKGGHTLRHFSRSFGKEFDFELPFQNKKWPT